MQAGIVAFAQQEEDGRAERARPGKARRQGGLRNSAAAAIRAAVKTAFRMGGKREVGDQLFGVHQNFSSVQCRQGQWENYLEHKRRDIGHYVILSKRE